MPFPIIAGAWWLATTGFATYGASKADDALLGGAGKRTLWGGIKAGFNKLTQDDEDVKPVATGVTVGPQTGPKATNTNFNESAQRTTPKTDAVLDVNSGEVRTAETTVEEKDNLGFFDYIMLAWDQFQKDDYMGAIGSVFNAFTKNSDGETDMVKSGASALGVLGGGLALKNLFSKDASTSGALKLGIASAAIPIITSMAKDWMNSNDKDEPAVSAKTTAAPTTQQKPAFAGLDL